MAAVNDNESSKSMNLEHMLRLDLTFLAHADAGPDWRGVQEPMPWTTRGFHMVVSGDGYLLVEGKRYDLLPGHIYYIPTDLTTERGCTTGYECYYGCFFCRGIGGQPLLTSHPYPLDLGMWDVTAMGHKETEVKNISKQLYAKSMVMAGLLQNYPGLADELDKMRATGPRFRKCLSYIEDNLSADLEVRTLAKVVGMSRNAFTRAFKAATGATPRAYLNSELNQQACNLVLTSDMSIREIGETLGFSDEYYFNRFFRKMNGTPPLRFRKSLS